ncbi:MAG: hypothetical protein JO358_15820 [Alphaproteobacteria bacterium]|nr:hypothetical protein [Alphaproteobacteria bacterium]
MAGFCQFQVGHLEPFTEPVRGGIPKCQRIGRTARVAEQPGEACGERLPGQFARPARPVAIEARTTPCGSGGKALRDASSRVPIKSSW